MSGVSEWQQLAQRMGPTAQAPAQPEPLIATHRIDYGHPTAGVIVFKTGDVYPQAWRDAPETAAMTRELVALGALMTAREAAAAQAERDAIEAEREATARAIIEKRQSEQRLRRAKAAYYQEHPEAEHVDRAADLVKAFSEIAWRRELNAIERDVMSEAALTAAAKQLAAEELGPGYVDSPPKGADSLTTYRK